MRNKLILAAMAALATAFAAAPAASFAQYDLYNIIYVAGGEQVGFARGVCGYSSIEHVLQWGQATGTAGREYVGVCIDGVPYYY